MEVVGRDAAIYFVLGLFAANSRRGGGVPRTVFCACLLDRLENENANKRRGARGRGGLRAAKSPLKT